MNTTTTEIIQAGSQVENGALALPMDAASLAQLGLTLEDAAEVRGIAQTIDPRNRLTVADFGRSMGTATAATSDAILDQVRSKDLDGAGTKLMQIVTTAQRLNLSALSDSRSKVPLIGAWIDKLRLTSSKVIAQFDTAKEQIDRLLSEVDETQQNLRARNQDMETMFGEVQDEYRTLGLYIAAGKIRLAEIREQADAIRAQATTPAAAQDLADLDATATNLDIRIANLLTLQQSAFNTLPQIRISQSNNEVLVDKFHTIRTVTVPAWKRQFALRLGLNEQQNAVQFATTVDDMTNQLMREQADLLHSNSVQTAKSNQRLAIDVETLEMVQGKLIQTVQDIIQINRDGADKRREVEQTILTMRANMKTSLIGP